MRTKERERHSTKYLGGFLSCFWPCRIKFAVQTRRPADIRLLRCCTSLRLPQLSGRSCAYDTWYSTSWTLDTSSRQPVARVFLNCPSISIWLFRFCLICFYDFLRVEFSSFIVWRVIGIMVGSFLYLIGSWTWIETSTGGRASECQMRLNEQLCCFLHSSTMKAQKGFLCYFWFFNSIGESAADNRENLCWASMCLGCRNVIDLGQN